MPVIQEVALHLDPATGPVTQALSIVELERSRLQLTLVQVTQLPILRTTAQNAPDRKPLKIT